MRKNFVACGVWNPFQKYIYFLQFTYLKAMFRNDRWSHIPGAVFWTWIRTRDWRASILKHSMLVWTMKRRGPNCNWIPIWGNQPEPETFWLWRSPWDPQPGIGRCSIFGSSMCLSKCIQGSLHTATMQIPRRQTRTQFPVSETFRQTVLNLSVSLISDHGLPSQIKHCSLLTSQHTAASQQSQSKAASQQAELSQDSTARKSCFWKNCSTEGSDQKFELYNFAKWRNFG